MTGFVISPPNTDAEPPAAPPADVVAGDGWWPDVAITDVRDAVRLDTNVPPARLRDAVRQAMVDMADQLADWRAGQEAAGHDSLADVPARMQVDGQSDWLLRWARAIYSCVAADLGDRVRGMAASAAGHDRADEIVSEAADHRRVVTFAVRDFLGRPRCAAELI